MNPLCRIELLGWLRVQQADRLITRFQTHKAGLLLAYLSLYRHRSHAREELADLFWPEDDPDSARHKLRVALCSLRHQLEPPGIPAGTVIEASRRSIQLSPRVCSTDVAEFEAVLQAARAAKVSRPLRIQRLVEAQGLYCGPLLPGYYESWIEPERQRLAEAHFQVLQHLITDLEQAGDLPGALDCARRAVTADPLREEAHQELIRLLAAAGQPDAALRQYLDLERILEQELDTEPTAATRSLILDLPAGRKLLSGTPREAHSQFESQSPVDAEAVTRAPTPAQPGEADIPADVSMEVPVRRPPSDRGNLPVQLTRFFNRENELARLRDLIRDNEARLVTLTGPGGCGKTRLAVEFARRVWECFQGAVWFVPLADLADSRLVAAEILKVLGRQQSSSSQAIEEVIDVLPDRQILLILDNFEHLLAEGTATVRTLLERVPWLVVLVTSRQCLKLAGEQELQVLPFPTTGQAESPEDLLRYECVQLFVDRAQAARPDFQVTRRNAAAVAALCRELEGIPLALELAAARSPVMTPSQMLARMTQRFELLVSRQHGTTRRHRTLRAAIQWSYELLSPKMRWFFVRLSVFRGGWSLEAAENICGVSSALDCLEHLRECSLVIAEEIADGSEPCRPREGRTDPNTTADPMARLTAVPEVSDISDAKIRFRMLETLREYALEQLSLEERQALALRHAQYYASIVEQGEAELNGPAQEIWLDRLETEQFNLRAALLWCEQRQETELGLRLAGALWRFWYVRGYWSIGRARLAGVLALPGTPHSAARAKALLGAGVLAHYQGDLEIARTLLMQSLAICRGLGEKQQTAAALTGLGFLARDQGEPLQAGAMFSEALMLGREAEDWRGVAMALAGLGDVALYQRSPGAARSFYQESLAIRRSLGDPRFLAAALNNLADLDRLEDPATARSLYEESLPIMRRLGSKGDIAWTLCGLAYCLLRQGDLRGAQVLLAESLLLRRELGNGRGMAECLEGLAAVAGLQGRHQQSIWLFGTAEALRERIHLPASPAHRADNDRNVAATRANLTVEQFLSAWAAGRAMTLEQAVTEALEEVCRPEGTEITTLPPLSYSGSSLLLASDVAPETFLR